MTRDKAIDIIRGELFGKAFDNPEVKEAFVKLIPELGDSWNENVRKQLMETVKTAEEIAEESGIKCVQYIHSRIPKEGLKIAKGYFDLYLDKRNYGK